LLTCRGAPEWGVLFLVSAMFEVNVFFENQAKECNLLAVRASDKSDREFWLRAARRWEALLTARPGPLDEEVRREHPYIKRRAHSYFRKRRRVA